MIRPKLYELLGHVVHARMELKALQEAVLDEMKQGYRPTHRGHEWSRDQFDALAAVSVSLSVSFNLLKAVQFPETHQGRVSDALSILADACDTLKV